MPTYVYDFSQGTKDMRELLGGKGANLAEMTSIGLPVPDGFTITTEACLAYLDAGGTPPEGLEREVDEHLGALEERTGKRLGDRDDPLLVSVRSGAPLSMPGMMDTILNLGLNDDSVQGLARQSENPRFAWDSYRRFVQMYGEVVAGVSGSRFEDALARRKRERGVREDVELEAYDLAALVATFRDIYRDETGEEFPQEPREQLDRAIAAVFDSWNTRRAKAYRRQHRISDRLGTAVNVVQMVFGNMGDDSATGVAFTRNPATGEKQIYGEFLVNAQGEDVVAGIRTPRPIAELDEVIPSAAKELREAMGELETHYGDMQDVEYTIEQGRLYVLQTRAGKRSAAAGLRVALDLVEEGVIGREEALLRVDPLGFDEITRPRIDPDADATVLAKGLPASPGAVVGKVVFDADTAERRGSSGEPVILVRPETTPDDYHGMIAAKGVLTARGGQTSHAAVVARDENIPCVVGAEELDIDTERGELRVDGQVVHAGDELTIDGGRGLVMLGAVELVPPPDEVFEQIATVAGWADEIRRLRVRANADTPPNAARARELGAEGIGLCRTEHMFMADDRLPVVREMILAGSAEGRRAALDRLLPFQQGDFQEIFEAMRGLPVTVRLLDPPLHEFLPNLLDLRLEIERLRERGEEGERLHELERLQERVEDLTEANPMLGTRGCRLGLLYPEIYEMQVRAIVRAALEVGASGVEIMHPLVGFREELARLRELTEEVIEEEGGGELGIVIGTMIEVPRAAVTADEIATVADFFSFGTNDLTQTTLAFSRDDAGRFLTRYIDQGLMEENPFQTIDRAGVGKLIELATRLARDTKGDIKLGICGQHGGDPASIAFCHEVGLDYVSCQPDRIPAARVAAAQAALRERDAD